MENSLLKDCSICNAPYDQFQHIPMILCSRQHICCKRCSSQILRGKPSKCPECRQNLSRQDVDKFRQYMDWLKEMKECHKNLKDKQAKAALLPQFSEAIWQVMVFQYHNQQQFYKYAKEKAENLFESGKKHVAITILMNLIEKFPDHNRYSFLGLGLKQENIGYSQGFPLSQFKQQYKVQNLSAQDLLNHFLMLTPQFQCSNEWYQKIASKHPENYRIVYGSAISSLNNGFLQNAEKACIKIIELKPDFSRSFCMIAFIDNDKDKMHKYANLCLQRQPSNIFAKYMIALNSEDKLNRLKEIVEQQPKYARVINEIGDFYYNKKKYSEAIEHYVASISINPDYFRPIINIGYAYHYSGDSNKAIQYLKNVLERQLSAQYRSQVLALLGRISRDMKDTARSISYYKESLQVNPSSIHAAIGLALIYKNSHKYHFAIKMYQVAEELSPKNTAVFEGIISCFKQVQRYTDVADYYKKWKNVDPENIAIDCNLAEVYFELKEWKNALEYYSICRERKYRLDYVNDKIADIHYNLKDYKSSLMYYGELMNSPTLPQQMIDIILEKSNKANEARKKSNSKSNR